MNSPENQLIWRKARNKKPRNLSERFCAAYDAQDHPELLGHETIRFHPHEDTLKAYMKHGASSLGVGL